MTRLLIAVRGRTLWFFLALSALALAPLASAQHVLFVDRDATGSSTGISWTDAFSNFQDALYAARDGDELWVAEGTYTSQGDPFSIRSSIDLYGGFRGDETTRDQREPSLHPTLITASSSSAALTVEDETVVIDGFELDGTIAGIRATNADLILRRMTVFESGTAVLAVGGQLTIEDSSIRDNLSGVRADDADVVVRRTLFLNNETLYFLEGSGTGGLSVSDGTLHLEDSLFDGNGYGSLYGHYGGGLLTSSTVSTVVRTRFINNYVDVEAGLALAHGGGAAIAAGGSAHFLNCVFAGNYVRAHGTDSGYVYAEGGGLYASSPVTCVNCVFVGNRVLASGTGLNAPFGAGGGAYSEYELTLIHSTIVGNEVTGSVSRGAGVSASSLFLTHTIVWANAGTISAWGGRESQAYRSIVEGGFPYGTAILDLAPRLSRFPHPGPDGAWGTPDDDYGDLRLQPGSPALDFGNAALLPPDTYDLDGDGDTAEPLPLDIEGGARIMGAAPDLGAHEGAVGVSAEPSGAITTFRLHAAYPNPFNPTTRILFDLPQSGDVTLTLFDILGREVAVRGPQPIAAGPGRSLTVDGAGLASGLYVYRLTASFGTQTRTATGTLTLLK